MNDLPSLKLSSPSAISPSDAQKDNKDFFKKPNDLFKQMLSLLDEIASAPKKMTRDMSSLNDKIKNIENSTQRIAKFEGGKVLKLPILGCLIKLFFNWYNNRLIAQKHQYEKKIKVFHQFLATFENEALAKIFDIENQMRILLEKDFPEKKKYQDIYSQHVLPIVQQAKQFITHRPFQFAAQAAAAKGKAAHASLQALKQLAENQPVIQSSGVSSQQVFLLPKEGVVFKRSDEQAKEEESLINDLFDLMSKQAVVGIFNIQKASADKFDIQFTEEVRARGLTPEDFSNLPSLRNGIKDKLSHHDRLLLQKHERMLPKVDILLKNYENIKKQTWYIKSVGQDWKSISFSDLQNLNLSHQLSVDTLIGTAPEPNKALSFHDHLLKETSFARALNYLPALHSSPNTLYFSPDLSNPKMRQAYETCEKYQWRYIDQSGKSHIVDFKTLHILSLQKTPMKGGLRAMQNNALTNASQAPYFHRLAKQALAAKWKAMSPELMHIDANTGRLSNLNDIQAKPFISNMILMSHLTSNAKEAILQRLTPDAEFNAILTAEFQLLDLHAKNLGVAPQSTIEYERYKNFQFSISSSPAPLSFQDLITQYLTDSIQLDTMIKFEEEGKTIEEPLKNLPELKKALDVRWQFVIFDTDLSLSEDNRLQLQIRKKVKEHLIPLRSVLLETTWKDQPLSNEAIQHLMDSDKRDLNVANWIRRADAPIYKHLSLSARQNVEQQLAPFIQEYTLSKMRESQPDTLITLKSLQNQFVKQLSDITQPKNLAIWQTLEQDLSSVTVRLDDTWEKITQRYHQNPNELRALNPQGLTSGQQVKIKYDLTSSSPEAVKKQKKIAAQLFPRITYRQQTALLERQQRRKEYLNNYQNLLQSTLKDKELITQIKQFLQRVETPLTSIRKEELLNDLKTYQTSCLLDHNDLLNLKKTICQECQPTYFNLTKAMYPLLADAYALNQAVYEGNKAEAGMAIGFFNIPLEKMINYTYATFPFDSPETQLAQNLANQIENIHDPAFFGHW